MTICQIEEREAGRAYPRTCPTCQLGRCTQGNDYASMRDTIARLTAEMIAARDAKDRAESILAASEMGGVLDGWIRKCEAMQRERDELIELLASREADIARMQQTAALNELIEDSADLVAQQKPVWVDA